MTYERYENYERRMQLLARVLQFIKKHYLKVVIPLGTVIAVTLILLSITGIFIENVLCDDLVYGEQPKCSAKAIFSDVEYEFVREGETLWTKEAPITAGTYRVRAVSHTGFGGVRYSEEAQFVILPLDLHLTVKDHKCTYGDLTEYSVARIEADGLLEGDRLVAATFSSVDLSALEFAVAIEAFSVVNADGVDVTSSYTPHLKEGTLSFELRRITLSSEDVKKIYDSSATEWPKCSVSLGSLAPGDSVRFIHSPGIVDVGTAEARFSAVITNSDGKDVTDNYEILYDFGQLTVSPRPVSLATNTEEQVYSGKPLKSEVWNLLDGGTLVDGHKINVRFTAEQTDVGECANTAEVSIVDENGTNVTHNYEVQLTVGTLRVVPRSLSVAVDDAEKIYDGVPLTNHQWKVVDGSLAPGQRISVETPASQINVGETTNVLNVSIFDEKGNDVSHNYSIQKSEGALRVLARPLTIKTEGAQKIYDGTALTCNVWNITVGTVAAGQRLTVTLTGSQTKVGESQNAFLPRVLDGKGSDVTPNYDIRQDLGILKVTTITLTIGTGSAQKVYDGQPLTKNSWSKISGTLAKGQWLDVTVTGSQTDAGESENTATIIVRDAKGNDVTADGYIIETDYGILTVTRRLLEVTSAGKEKKYDGIPLIYRALRGSPKGQLLEEHSTSLTFSGIQVGVGSSPNYFTAKVVERNGRKDVTDNYEIIYEYGTLTVLPNPELPEDDEYDINFPQKNDEEGGATASTVTVSSNETAVLYLRKTSYGDYTGKGWKPAVPYNAADGSKPMYFAGETYQANKSVSFVNVKFKLSEFTPFLLPYYTTDSGSPALVENDIRYVFSNKEYSVRTLINKGYSDFVSLKPSKALTASEKAYREFVYQKYTDVPASTKNELVKLAAKNGIAANSATLITDIQEYISHAAKYNLDAKEYPSGCDKVVYFLTVAKEGICQHFASAATLMYRTFGIPARYTTGYMVEAKGMTETKISNDNAHAWVEIYLDGIGWVQIEVTPGGFILDNDDLALGERGEQGSGGWATVYSSQKATLYLRQKSFGAYAGNKWKAATAYTATDGSKPMYFAGETLLFNNPKENFSKIKLSTSDDVPFLLPYYSTDARSPATVENDIQYLFGSKSYSVDAMVNKNYSEFVTLKAVPNLSQQEKDYREFVYRNYLEVPANTKSVLLDLAKKNGISSNSSTIISDIQKYIFTAASYNTEFEELPQGQDFVVYFLTVAKEGNCQHFASAATLMYRSFGIPARHTVGYVVEVEAGETKKFGRNDAHAWVEIYLDGIGWIEIEVTPGRGGGGSGSGGEETVIRSPEDDDTVYAQITYYQEGSVYLREKSYGEYTGRSWTSAPRYSASGSANPLYYAANALSGVGYSSISIRRLNDCPALLPYYAKPSNSVVSATDDVSVDIKSINYSIPSVIGMTYKDFVGRSTTNRTQESNYRKFVYSNYLAIPESTKAAMLKIAQENGISAKSATVIEDVQNYISTAARYNKDVADFPAGVDVAVYFLTTAKEGCCQHFASAATLMYRTLGIPARYTVGFVKEAGPGQTVDVTGNDAHAWVEIYLDGVGWIQMEVTASQWHTVPGGGGGGEAVVNDEGKCRLVISASSAEKVYDGKSFSKDVYQTLWIKEGALLAGHRFERVDFHLARQFVDPGSTFLYVGDVKIVDENGKDVTDQYVLIKLRGTFTIKKRPITICSTSATKKYDGTPLKDDRWWIAEGSLAYGDEITVSVTGSRDIVGSSVNTVRVTSIKNTSTKKDVKSCYEITVAPGTLTVKE